MNHIFEIKDKSGRKIRLTKTQWGHIKHKHPDVNESFIEETLKNPINIVLEEDGIAIYYRYFKTKKPLPYLKVMAKYLNGGGYVITAYFVKNILQ